MSDWNCLALEIRLMILNVLLQDGCNLFDFATVSREWQTPIERHNFSRIKLTPSRLDDFGQMLHRNRSLVRYIWLCMELQEYPYSGCKLEEPQSYMLDNWDNDLIATAYQDVFRVLSTWERSGSLLLDVSIYSCSDSEQFKHLTIEPDIAVDICGRNLTKQLRSANVDDQRRGKIARTDYTSCYCQREEEWWRQLPSVSAVTGLLLRQQNRRRWRAHDLERILDHLPGLQEFNYEPWRGSHRSEQKIIDGDLQCLFLPKSPSSCRLQKLVLFENFNQEKKYRAIRKPCPHVSRAIVLTSLTLQQLSASFMVDACEFFDARRRLPARRESLWPNLTSLALTSRLLVPQRYADTEDESIKLNTMLERAAAAALEMPKLETMEIWNGQKGLAMLFRYQRPEPGCCAVIYCRGTSEISLRSHVMQVWNAVARSHGGEGHEIVHELLDAGCIKHHGDAIRHLKLSKPVVRPVSLQQIEKEHMIQAQLRADPLDSEDENGEDDDADHNGHDSEFDSDLDSDPDSDLDSEVGSELDSEEKEEEEDDDDDLGFPS